MPTRNARRPDLKTDPSQLRGASDASNDTHCKGFDEKYRPLVLRWCRQFGLDGHEADDRAQEILIEVARRLPTFSYDPSMSFRSWLKAVVRRRVIDHYRKPGNDFALLGGADLWVEAPEGSDEGEPSESDVRLRELAREVQKNVEGRFQPSSWRLFVRVDLDGLTLSEAAGELGMSVSNACKRRNGVRAALRREGEEVLKRGDPQA